MIGLPSLRDLDDRSIAPRIWLCTSPIDMRLGFDRLAELASTVTDQDPLSGHLFFFRSRGGDRLKAMYFDRDGFALWYKRLKEGTFRLPKVDDATKRSLELRPSDLARLLDGIDLRSVKRTKRYAEALAPVGVAEDRLDAAEAQAEHLAQHEAREELRQREVFAVEPAGVRAKRASAKLVRPPHHRPWRLRGPHRASSTRRRVPALPNTLRTCYGSQQSRYVAVSFPSFC
jgi:transposase